MYPQEKIYLCRYPIGTLLTFYRMICQSDFLCFPVPSAKLNSLVHFTTVQISIVYIYLVVQYDSIYLGLNSTKISHKAKHPIKTSFLFIDFF